MSKGGMKLTIQGDELLAHTLTQVSKVVQESTEAEMERMAQEVMQGSIERAPFKTGDLEDSHQLN